MDINNFIRNRFDNLKTPSFNRKCINIYIIWSLLGVIIVSDITSGSDPIGLAPIAFLYYFLIWLAGGVLLVFGIGLYYKVNKYSGIIFYIGAVLVSFYVIDKYFN